ncbi:MAG: DoxX family protein [Elusimicrobia bacterium RIFOXYD12_FULL_66_9]|nr:MAG: DoxX family protein [Elusimicrobia bacterium RIFOXYD12_FULL_66_9]
MRIEKALILIRLSVGSIFLSEGIQKFLFPEALGVGRFIKIGIPAPEQLAPFVGVVEIVCGALLLLGLFSRLAVMPLLAVIGTALVTTKVPVLLKDGFWKAAHESRTDWSMLLSLLFLLVAGAGPWSFDARRSRRDGR